MQHFGIRVRGVGAGDHVAGAGAPGIVLGGEHHGARQPAGSGVGELPPVVQPDLVRKGRLVEVMPDWRFPTFDLSLVHLGNRHMPKPTRLFKEFATQMAPTLFPSLPT